MDSTHNMMEAKAAQLGARPHEWNELDFVGWKEFRRMAPAVISLEISRLDRVLASCEPASDEYNTLVQARFELRAFTRALENSDREGLAEKSRHLNHALLAVSLLAEQSETLQYVVRRLDYVAARLRLVY